MRKFICLLLCLFYFSTLFAEPLRIAFWHSMAGHLGQVLIQLTQDFNQSQSDYEIVPIYKGNYNESMTSLVAAFRAHKQPPLIQVAEVNTQTMIKPKGIVIPVYRLFNQFRINFDYQDMRKSIRDYYSTPQGELLALPFNSSSAVLYYNKDAFKQAGLAPRDVPRTWEALERISKRLLDSGYQCGFTTTFPSWIQIENFLAWHGFAFSSNNNGFGGLSVDLKFNNLAMAWHLEALKRWQAQGIFKYGGRDDNAVSLFTSGYCAMMTQSSGSFLSLKKMVPFDMGVSTLPYWSKFTSAPHRSIIGGAALWVIQGYDEKTYHGVARFLYYLSQAEIQSKWQMATGYLPISKRAERVSEKKGFYRQYPEAKVALEELQSTNGQSKALMPGIRIGSYSRVRVVNDDAIESVVAGIKQARNALLDAIKNNQRLLRRFKENVSS